jgi:hypothetical protein
VNKKISFLSALLVTSVLFAVSPPSMGDDFSGEGDLMTEPSAPAHTDEATVTGTPEAEAPVDDLQAELEEGGENPKAKSGEGGAGAEAGAPQQIVTGSGGAEPTDFEKRLFRIFKNNSEPVSVQKWEELVGSRKQEVYVVQPGDTLWDISSTLFGDGFFWSKLWAENGNLENPHQITPNQQIQLMAGTEASGPAISVGRAGAPGGEAIDTDSVGQSLSQNSAGSGDVDSGSLVASGSTRVPLSKKGPGRRAPVYREQALKDLTPEELASGANIEIDELVPTPEIPSQKPGRKVLKNLPRSFVMPTRPKIGQFDSTGLDAPATKAQSVPPTIIPNSYLADHPVDHVGVIEEIEAQEKIASTGQSVYIRLDSKGRIGERFSVLFPKDKISTGPASSLGPVVEIGGRVEITSVVNEDKNVYRATVVQTVNPIRNASILVRENLPKSNYSRRGTRTTIESKIIGGEYDGDRKIIGDGSVVYLDQGRQAGLNPGDILPVQAKRSERREGTKFPDDVTAIGLLKIVKVEETAATAIVLESRSEIHVGDHTGGRLSPSGFIREEMPDEGSSVVE